MYLITMVLNDVWFMLQMAIGKIKQSENVKCRLSQFFCWQEEDLKAVMYICVLVQCSEMVQMVHTWWTANLLPLTWEGSTLPAGLLTSCYNCKGSFLSWPFALNWWRPVCVSYETHTEPSCLRSVRASRVTEGVMGVGVASPLPCVGTARYHGRLCAISVAMLRQCDVTRRLPM
jgi:hypothetical protein